MTVRQLCREGICWQQARLPSATTNRRSPAPSPTTPACRSECPASESTYLLANIAGGAVLAAPLAFVAPSWAADNFIAVENLSSFQRSDQRAYFQVATSPCPQALLESLLAFFRGYQTNTIQITLPYLVYIQ